MNKVFHTVEISTEEQDIIIAPGENWDNYISITTQQLNGKPSDKLHLSEDEFEFMVAKIREMFNYIKQK